MNLSHYTREINLHKRHNNWPNVISHCKTVACRAEALANLLKIEYKLKDKIVRASLVHDFYKKKEVALAKKDPVKGFLLADINSKKILKRAGYDNFTIKLATCMADENLPNIERLAEKIDLSQEELSILIVHYADDISRGVTLVSIDDRMNAFENDPKYKKLNESTIKKWGETIADRFRKVGHLAEKKFGDIMYRNSGVTLKPNELPNLVEDTSNNYMKHKKTDIKNVVKAFPIISTDKKIVTHKLLSKKLKKERDGKKVIFLSGSFDILHLGHLLFFDFAKKQDGILVVGVATDKNIQYYKGPKRPIIPEALRVRLIAGFEVVDYVVLLDEKIKNDLDIMDFCRLIKPDMLIALDEDPLHEEYKMLGKETGFKVKKMPRIQGISTSWIIQEVKNRY